MQVTLIPGNALKLDLVGAELSKVKQIPGAIQIGSSWYIPAIYPNVKVSLRHLDTIHESWVESKEVHDLRLEIASIDTEIECRSLAGYTPKLKPYSHQEEALSKVIYNPRFGLLLDPGLGKTKVACDYMQYLKNSNNSLKVLILALRVNLNTWVKETIANCTTVSTTAIKSQTKQARDKAISKEYAANTAIVLTYDSARSSVELLESLKFDLIIADESHSLRTPDSARTKAILKLMTSKNAPARRLILSGTPSLGNPLHVWGQLKLLGNYLVPDIYKFRAKYLKTSPWNSNIVLGSKNIDELNAVVSSISIRKKATDCLDLPDRIFQTIEVDPTSEMKDVYNRLVNYEQVSISDGTDQIILPAPENAVTAMTKAAQVTSGFVYKSKIDKQICDYCPHLNSCVANSIKPYTSSCKVEQEDPGREVVRLGGSPVIDSVVELAETHMLSGSKVIVWARYRETLDILNTELSKLGTVYRYDHTTESPSEVEQAFNQDSNACIILAQISMGIGVTFKSSVMIYAELSFSLDHWLQSLDRNYGIRAKGFSSLLVQIVVIKNSLASSTIDLLNSKVDVSNLISTRPNCVTCNKAAECLLNGTLPFKEGCIYPSTSEKLTIPLKEI